MGKENIERKNVSMKDYIKENLLRNARLAMKQGFDSLSDEKKKQEFIKLLDKNTELQQREEKLIKYLEDNIKEEYIGGADICSPCRFEKRKQTYQEILERIKSGKYE